MYCCLNDNASNYMYITPDSQAELGLGSIYLAWLGQDPLKPAIHFTDKLYILESEKEKAIKKSMEMSQTSSMVGIQSGLKSDRKIRGTLKEDIEKNNALRRLKPRFEGSIN
ncbi:hypothetical protein AVEN_42857-1 [Araneus ventricosus]|uniref:Uncharacterized protein n=1 Tax=Araneus ventricosus TaxID=182803 RepID=A0A4Y2AGG0_ARAVE|nr:hypothetical protein AVEN_42857-1 [Araneus ventricosus]